MPFSSNENTKTMMTVMNSLPTDILGIKISGKLKKEDFDKLNPVVDKFKSQNNKIKLYVEYTNFEWPSFEAMWEDLKFGFNNLGDISKMAMVSDKQWIEEGLETTGHILPRTDIEGFELGERDKAMAWISK